MIPPVNAVQDDRGGKEDERDQDEAPKSPTMSASQQETKVCPVAICFPIQLTVYSRMQLLENCAEWRNFCQQSRATFVICYNPKQKKLFKDKFESIVGIWLKDLTVLLHWEKNL